MLCGSSAHICFGLRDGQRNTNGLRFIVMRRTKRRIPGSICGIIRDIRHLHLRRCMSGTRVSGRDIQI